MPPPPIAPYLFEIVPQREYRIQLSTFSCDIVEISLRHTSCARGIAPLVRMSRDTGVSLRVSRGSAQYGATKRTAQNNFLRCTTPTHTRTKTETFLLDSGSPANGGLCEFQKVIRGRQTLQRYKVLEWALVLCYEKFAIARK